MPFYRSLAELGFLFEGRARGGLGWEEGEGASHDHTAVKDNIFVCQ